MRRFLRAWWAWAADVVDDLLDAADHGSPRPRDGVNKVKLAIAIERLAVSRYLRERATYYHDDPFAARLLRAEADRIAGGMHYR